MAEDKSERRFPFSPQFRQTRLREEDAASANKYLREVLTTHKKDGLQLAVQARWFALAVIALFLPLLNFAWEMVYYEVALVGFAIIGWAQLQVGRIGQSRQELYLIFADLALLTFIFVVPNPFSYEPWPTAMQYHFNNFYYFYVFLATATMAYSWRTLVAFGNWVAGLWMGSMVLAVLFGKKIPELSTQIADALAGHEVLIEYLDPNRISVGGRLQEVLVFVIVAFILAANSRRTNTLLFKQANVARERANLARHFPPNIVDQMATRDQPLGPVRSQNVAVMFADIVGFTGYAESHEPQAIVATLREFHHRLEQAVFNHQGTLDKFLGDGIMATFGTPEPGPEDADNALLCAKEMLATITAWNQERVEAGDAPITLSIGIHYGEVVLGDIGSERRLEFAAIGDAVNVASRLEAKTRELDVQMIVSDALVSATSADPEGGKASLLAGLISCEEQSIRGRDDPIKIWTYTE